MTRQLEGRTALITGANRGIGLAVARAYAREGARCILAARNKPALDRAVIEIKASGGEASAVAIDLGSPDSVRAATKEIAASVTKLDILVANAAVLGARVPLAQYPFEAWIHTFQVNVHANLLLLQGLDALLRKSDAGRVIFLSAGSARTAKAGSGSYAVSKSALEAMAGIYGREVAGTPIKINIVNPEPTRTGMRATVAPMEDPMSLKTPEGLAPLFLELASPACGRQGEWINADVWLGK